MAARQKTGITRLIYVVPKGKPSDLSGEHCELNFDDNKSPGDGPPSKRRKNFPKDEVELNVSYSKRWKSAPLEDINRRLPVSMKDELSYVLQLLHITFTIIPPLLGKNIAEAI